MDSNSSRARSSVARDTTKSTRRSWSLHEELVLISALKELVVSGWKCDNGFRTGYQNLLEKSMLQAIPGTDLRAEPHINSRIHVWKKNHSSIATMLTRSGFGWNDTSNTIIVDSDQVWDNFVKTDSNARTMRHKSWPLYKDWCEVFGKDRATGENAEAFEDVARELRNNTKGKDNGKEKEVRGNQVPNFNPTEDFDEAHSMSDCHGENSVSGKNKSTGKRKTIDDSDHYMQMYMNMMGSFCDRTDSRLGEIAMRVGSEHDAKVSRKAVFEALSQITSLEMEDRIYVATELVNNTKKLDLFFSMPIDAQTAMVKMMLQGRI
ncbi:hypothetical protein BUALT_Bualt15G0039800 [Buddleja alternifolia]|uniref:Myb/SANT-like domain-containing protein n=1 Tax=Buddleja alternifolia TaxID=168488 RepID=A0AAV6WCP3_9LAMI|nr:hypothetical protein BUALT_Bualt15G0039800 [Buddleja alternifolia]